MTGSSYPRRRWSARARKLGVPRLLDAYRHLVRAADGAAGRAAPRGNVALFPRVSWASTDLPALEVPEDVAGLERQILADPAGRRALELIDEYDPDPRVRDRAWGLLHPFPPRRLDQVPAWLRRPAYGVQEAEDLHPLYSVVLGEDEPGTFAELCERGLGHPGWSWQAGGPIQGSGPWPRRRSGVPLAFLAQVDTRRLLGLHDWPAIAPVGLPTSGFLQFFFDLEDYDGLDQDDPTDSWCVRLVPHRQVEAWASSRNRSSGGNDRRAMPGFESWPPGPTQDFFRHPTLVSLRQWPSLPAQFDDTNLQAVEALALAATVGRRQDMKLRQYAADVDAPYSHLLGYPAAWLTQSMDDLTEYCHRTGRPVAPDDDQIQDRGSDPWILLADISGTRSLEDYFGDCGRCEFWIRSSDLRTHRFDRVIAMRQGEA